MTGHVHQVGRSSQPPALRVFAIWSSADLAASAVELFFVAIDSSAFCKMLALSTLAQFGVFGTNQVFLAASPVDSFACACASSTFSSDVVFGMANLASAVWLCVSVKILIHSAPRPTFADFCGTARSEPPRNDGVYLPASVPGSGNVASLDASAGLPVFLSITEPTSQPLPRIAPTCSCDMIASWSDSSLVAPPTEYCVDSFCHWVSPCCASELLSVPCHVPPCCSAILPPAP